MQRRFQDAALRRVDQAQCKVLFGHLLGHGLCRDDEHFLGDSRRLGEGSAFIQARVRHQDIHGVNLLNSALSSWIRYHDFLVIIRDRYEQLSTPYIEAIIKGFDSVKTEAGPGQSSSRTLTTEEQLEMQRLHQIGQVLHLDIESFYVFANILLDRIASTFRYYFWRKPEWNHRQLMESISKICEKKSLSVVPDNILGMPADLEQRIVKYRNKLIEHVEEPRIVHATRWDADKKAKIAPSLLFPMDEEEDSFQHSTGDIDEILARVDRYIIAMLDFFDANAEKSILPLSKSK